jgi:hypothetical protein
MPGVVARIPEADPAILDGIMTVRELRDADSQQCAMPQTYQTLADSGLCCLSRRRLSLGFKRRLIPERLGRRSVKPWRSRWKACSRSPLSLK